VVADVIKSAEPYLEGGFTDLSTLFCDCNILNEMKRRVSENVWSQNKEDLLLKGSTCIISNIAVL
jgi:hypothetical protein